MVLLRGKDRAKPSRGPEANTGLPWKAKCFLIQTDIHYVYQSLGTAEESIGTMVYYNPFGKKIDVRKKNSPSENYRQIGVNRVRIQISRCDSTTSLV